MAANAVDLLLSRIGSGNKPSFVTTKLDAEFILHSSTGALNQCSGRQAGIVLPSGSNLLKQDKVNHARTEF